MKRIDEIEREIAEIEKNKQTIEELLKITKTEMEYDIRTRVRDEMTAKIDTLKWVINNMKKDMIEIEFEGINYQVEYDAEDGVVSIGLAEESKDVDLVDIINNRLYWAIVRKIEQS